MRPKETTSGADREERIGNAACRSGELEELKELRLLAAEALDRTFAAMDALKEEIRVLDAALDISGEAADLDDGRVASGGEVEKAGEAMPERLRARVEAITKRVEGDVRAVMERARVGRMTESAPGVPASRLVPGFAVDGGPDEDLIAKRRAVRGRAGARGVAREMITMIERERAERGSKE